jgi:uncharacterized protein YfaP (DUF2135 family)
VELRFGVNTTTGTTTASVSTSSGAYAFTDIPAGAYTLIARGTGYADGVRTGVVVGSGTTVAQQDILLSPSAGAARAVLTWGATPRDLDSHMTGPGGGGARFWVYYGSRGNCLAAPFACLDVDDTNGNGPETMTIGTVAPGVYRYYVYDFTNNGNGGSTALGASGARVQFYVGNTLKQTFFVPGGAGNAWAVFEWDGTNLTVLNQLYVISGTPRPAMEGNPPVPRTAAEEELRRLMRQLPAKPPR